MTSNGQNTEASELDEEMEHANPDASRQETRTNGITHDRIDEEQSADPGPEASAAASDGSGMEESSAPNAETSNNTVVPEDDMATRYPELHAEMAAYMAAQARCDDDRAGFEAAVDQNEYEVLNLWRIQSLSVQFAARMEHSGQYSEEDLDDWRINPLVEADLERILQVIHRTNRGLRMLGIRRAALMVWGADLHTRFEAAEEEEEARMERTE
ncbi:uncharacterized protein BKCO1_3000234 [Diplodia corticola]|uniref:Uncharacterized protein n=1 Tax=Diplodia corticola TaxID=236234 RepID=A0A1J9SGW4_9PEZI|nr:uncharacterized protein BKCO1_3000234 [Diplodia corticola]OJD39036.1 hypothetical protein BKCO1_3000234 [Diplodia corticola]